MFRTVFGDRPPPAPLRAYAERLRYELLRWPVVMCCNGSAAEHRQNVQLHVPAVRVPGAELDLGSHVRQPLLPHELGDRQALWCDVGLFLQTRTMSAMALGVPAGLEASVPFLLAPTIVAVPDIDDDIPERLRLAAPTLPLTLVYVSAHVSSSGGAREFACGPSAGPRGVRCLRSTPPAARRAAVEQLEERRYGDEKPSSQPAGGQLPTTSGLVGSGPTNAEQLGRFFDGDRSPSLKL